MDAHHGNLLLDLFIMDIGGIPQRLQDLTKPRWIWSPRRHSMRGS